MGKFNRDTPISDMDSQRAILDALMGVNRNNDREEDEINDWRDKRVCKCFLAGLCPNDLFQNTKSDMGACKQYHSEALKLEFENNNSNPYIYDDYLEREYETYVSEADRTIRKARLRLGDEKDEPVTVDPNNPELLRIQTQLDIMIGEVEKSGELGDIDTAMLLMQTVEALEKSREDMLGTKKKDSAAGGLDTTKKLRVCDICGSFLSVYDSDKRLADHFLGKQHIGYQKMREMLEAIRERRKLSRSSTSERRGDDRTDRRDNRNDRSDDRSGRRDDRSDDRSGRRDDRSGRREERSGRSDDRSRRDRGREDETDERKPRHRSRSRERESHQRRDRSDRGSRDRGAESSRR